MRGLHGLGQQPLDLLADGERSAVAVVGVAVVAQPSGGELVEDGVVVAHADAHARGADALGGGLSGRLPEGGRVGDPAVGVAVGDQDDRRARLGAHPPGLLQPAEVPGRQVGHPARLDRADGADDVVSTEVADLPGGDDDLRGVVEDDEAEAVAVVQATDDVDERLLGVVEPVAGHRAGAVEDDHGGVRWSGLAGVGSGGGDELEQDLDLVGLFEGDDVDVGVRGDVHGGGVLLGLVGRGGGWCGVRRRCAPGEARHPWWWCGSGWGRCRRGRCAARASVRGSARACW